MFRTCTKWPGSSKPVKYVLVTILLFSVLSWALAIAFNVQVLNHHHDDQYHAPGPPPSGACLYFASTTGPMVCTLATATELVLLHYNLLHPIASLTWSTVAVLGWAGQLFTIINLDWYDSGYNGETCNLVYLDASVNHVNLHWDSKGEYGVRVLFATVVAVGYCVYLGVAAAAVHRVRVGGGVAGAGKDGFEMEPKVRVGSE